jgi:tRNA threonylcarbamoyladenosine biosynthesis protein TsaE
MEKEEKFITNSEEETINLGIEFAKRLNAGDTVLFFGDLGAGKTELIKGICQYFKVDDIVTSPTFTIMNQYIGRHNGSDITIYHIDLYRIKSKKELEEIGFSECVFSSDSLKLIEWAEKAGSNYPDNAHKVKFDLDNNDEDKRIISFPV